MKNSTFDPVRDIQEFHEHFELSYQGPPRHLPAALEPLRIDRLYEEIDEYSAAKASLHDKLDGLVDLVYIALGNAYLHGFDFREAWRRVHEANMKKVRALNASDSKHDSAYDVVKPPGWTAPDLSDLLT